MSDEDSGAQNGATLTEQAADERAVALLSMAVKRSQFAARAGMQYGGKRDVYETAGYIKGGSETFDDYWNLYQRGDVAARIVELAPHTTWKDSPEIVLPEGTAGGEQFVADVKALADRLGLWNRFMRLDKLSRIGRYGVMLIGVVEDGDDLALLQPLPDLRGPEDVAYLSVFSEKWATIKKWETDPSSPRFGLPLIYQIDLSAGVAEFPGKTVSVHHSRLLHVAEDALEDDVFGRPVLKRVLNRLMDLEKVSASTGEAFWQLASRVLTGEVDPNVDFTEDQVKELGEKLEEVVHSLRRQFIGRGVDLNWLESTPPDPEKAADLYFMLLAAGAGIPKRILFGTETGERASIQDERAWLGSIKERREQHAEPNILRAFIDRLVSVKALPSPGEAGYEVQWVNLFEASDLEKAEANKATAETARSLAPMGGDPRELVGIDSEGMVYLRELDPETFTPFPTVPPLQDPGPPEAGGDG